MYDNSISAMQKGKWIEVVRQAIKLTLVTRNQINELVK